MFEDLSSVILLMTARVHSMTVVTRWESRPLSPEQSSRYSPHASPVSTSSDVILSHHEDLLDLSISGLASSIVALVAHIDRNDHVYMYSQPTFWSNLVLIRVENSTVSNKQRCKLADSS